MNAIRDLRQNPVFLREAGFAFTGRFMGVSPGLAKVSLILGLFAFLVIFASRQSGRFEVVYLVMAIGAVLVLPILALIVMLSAPRGIRMRGGISSIANLMTSPLTPRDVALGMLLGQGFPAMVGGFGFFCLGTGLLAMTNPVESQDPEVNLLIGVILLFAGPMLVDLFVDGFKAGLKREGFAISAVMSNLLTIASYTIYPLATHYVSEKAYLGYRRGIESAEEIFYPAAVLAFLFALLRIVYCTRNLLNTSRELARACEEYWERGDAS